MAIIQVSSGGKEIGELTLDDNKLLKGSKHFNKMLGPKTASKVILMTMWMFKGMQDCGHFIHKDKQYQFALVDETLKKKKKK